MPPLDTQQLKNYLHDMRSPLSALTTIINDLAAGYKIEQIDITHAQLALQKTIEIIKKAEDHLYQED